MVLGYVLAYQSTLGHLDREVSSSCHAIWMDIGLQHSSWNLDREAQDSFIEIGCAFNPPQTYCVAGNWPANI